MATKRAAVPKVSAGIGMPQDIAQARQYVEPMLKTQQENLAEQARLGQELLGAQQKEAEATAARDIGVKEAEAQALAEGAKAERGLVEEYQQKIEKNPFPSYKPSQEDLTTYAQLGSMIATAGLLLGAGGKSSSKVAIGAMTGMLNGWRQGRKDLWNREARTFEKELQKVKAEHDSIRKELEMGLKLAATDREAARAKLSAAAWKAGTNSVIASKINTGQFQSALDMTKKSGDLLMNIDKTVLDLAGKERAARDAAEQARLQREAMIEAARRKEAAQGKMDSKTKSEIRGNLATLGNISDLSRMIPTVPDAPVVFGIIGGNVPENIQQLYSSPQAQQAISLLQNISSQILKLRSGATVTVAEFARQRGFLPQRQDNTEAIQNKLRGLWDAVTNETVGYGLTQKQLAETANEISQIPEPLARSYRPTTKADQSLGTRRSQNEWKIEEVKK